MASPEKPIRPEGFEDIIEDLQFQKKRIPAQYIQTIIEIRAMAKGGDPVGAREEYYPGWENADFEDLLMELGEAK